MSSKISALPKQAAKNAGAKFGIFVVNYRMASACASKKSVKKEKVILVSTVAL